MTLRSDPAEIARAMNVLFEAGDTVEMRVPKTEREGCVSGYFTDHGTLAKCLAARNSDTAVYVTLNPVKPALLARAANHIKSRAKVTTSDQDIEHRRWLLVDCDPVRPAEISSSEVEHEAALERARDIRMVLSEENWPAPVLADSGNGAHLLYRIDLPNDDATTKLIEAVLKALAKRFDDEHVKVDQGVFNAARITKAYGTVSRKGDNIPERPHRVSRIVDQPVALVPVAPKLLAETAAAPEPPPVRPTSHRTQHFDVEGFLARYLQARAPVAENGGRKWLLEQCPFNAEHRAPDAAIFEHADGRLGFKCFHASCSGKTWKDVRALFEPRIDRSQSEGKQAAQTVQRGGPPLVLDCAEVLKVETPAEEMLFEGYPSPARGATLIVGAPKSGKTLLAVQKAVAVARDKPLFDNYRVLKPGPVMIVEQDDPGGAASIKTILERSGVTADLPFYLVPSLPFGFGDALLDWLRHQITERKLRLVVLDSYTALRGPRGPGIDIVKVEQTELSRIDALAKQVGAAIQIVHHGSKGAANLDWTQSAAGSYVMAAATEAQIQISRFIDLDSAATERLVRIRGRHGADLRAVLRFRKDTLDFEFLLDGGAAENYPVIRDIYREMGRDAIFGPKELAQAIGVSRATAFRMIARLRAAGALQKRNHGEYQFVADMRLLRL
jgi:hypothetical protein